MIDTKNDETGKARSTDICECGDQRSFHVDRLGCGVSGCGCTKFVLKKDETATAQPTDEAFVKQYYPDAELVGWIDGACAIFSQRRGLASSTGYIGWSQEKSNVSSTRAHKQAWRDARERIEALMPVAPSEPAPTIAESAVAEQILVSRSRAAAKELVSFLDISYPRGTSYRNSVEQTVAICIEQNMKGIHRE